MSKGSAQRGGKAERAKFAAGWDAAFGKKRRTKPVRTYVKAWAEYMDRKYKTLVYANKFRKSIREKHEAMKAARKAARSADRKHT